MLAVIAVFVQISLLNSAGRRTNDIAAQDISAAGKANTAPELEYPANGYIFFSQAGENACPLTIKTQGDQAYFIKLENSEGKDVLAFFVRPGQTADMMAPVGRYMIKYASGITWYGTEDLFGAATVYTRAEGAFDFTYSDGSYHGWIIKLYQAADANIIADSIDAADF
ncbi:MAG: hypothetical protein GX572_00145 [Clostridia bacterium]|nr:hypothetical protein [Clostridia bacterium]